MADQKEHAELSMMASGSEPRNLLIDGTVSRGFEPGAACGIGRAASRGGPTP